MSIYFDNSATTQMDDKVFDYMRDFNERYYANPSALHRFGFLVEKEIKNAALDISNILHVDPSEIIWTSGGTESNNLALYGYAISHMKLGNHIITTKIEHPSVLNVCKMLQEIGFDISYLSVDETGHIDLKELEDKITDKTILVSIMYVNNEIGSIQEIGKIGELIKERNNRVAFHVDFVQGFGKIKINCKTEKIDMLSISSHKFYGPKGVGILYKNKNCRVNPMILGGGQQNGLRSGTLNTLGIVGTAFAAKSIYEDFDKEVNHLKELKNYLYKNLLDLNKKYNIIKINSRVDDGFAPHILSISFTGIKSEVMLHALDESSIFVSAGSACSSHEKHVSNTLSSIGLSRDLLDATIRVSFGKYNTVDEIDEFISTLEKLIPVLGKYK